MGGSAGCNTKLHTAGTPSRRTFHLSAWGVRKGLFLRKKPTEEECKREGCEKA